MANDDDNEISPEMIVWPLERLARLMRAREHENDLNPAQWEAWESAHAELHEPGLRLQAADKSYAADEILIHIQGSEAWWRGE